MDDDAATPQQQDWLKQVPTTELLREILKREEQATAPAEKGSGGATQSSPLSISEIMTNEYKAIDLVELKGGFNVPVKLLTINRGAPIHLAKTEFVLFLVLAAHSLSQKGLPSPRRIKGGRFLSTAEILRAVDEWRGDEPRLAGFWLNATFLDVHRAIHALRKKIREHGFNPNIIESGPKPERGYRLSTPPYNVKIVLE